MDCKAEMYKNCVTEEEVRSVNVTWQQSYEACEKNSRSRESGHASNSTDQSSSSKATSHTTTQNKKFVING